MSNNINFDYKNLSPFKWFVLENFPFIEADFDALTEWQLFCKIGKEINKIIDSQNIVGEQAENLTNAFNNLKNYLTNAFNNLKNYVDNYFDNLDVQDEINNKLNEMVTDGTLQRLLLNYVNLIRKYNTINEMINDNTLTINNIVKVYGFYDLNDNGGGDYIIVDSKPSSFNIQLNNGLYAKMIIPESGNPEMFGAKGDGINDDTEYVKTAIENLDIIILNKQYLVSQIIFNNIHNKIITGTGSLLYKDGWLEADDNSQAFIIFNECTNIKIENITLDAKQNWLNNTLEYNSRPLKTEPNYDLFLSILFKTVSCIKFFESENINIYNIICNHCSHGIFLTNTVNSSVSNCKIYNTWADGCFIVGSCKNITVSDMYYEMVNDDQNVAVGFQENDENNPSFISYNNCISHNCWGAVVCFEGSNNCYANNCISDNCNYAPLKGGSQIVDGNREVYGKNQNFSNCYVKMSNRVQTVNNTLSIISGIAKNNENITYNNCIIDGTNMPNTYVGNLYHYHIIINNCRFKNFALQFNGTDVDCFSSKFISNGSIRSFTLSSTKNSKLKNNYFEYKGEGQPVVVGTGTDYFEDIGNTYINRNGYTSCYIPGTVTNLTTDNSLIRIENLYSITKIYQRGCMFAIDPQLKPKFVTGQLIYNTTTNSVEII